jgi:hypothetical protein
MRKPCRRTCGGKKWRCKQWNHWINVRKGVSFTRGGGRRARNDAPISEGIRKFALADRADLSGAGSAYYGMSTSRYHEPIDQLDVFLLISRLQRMGADIGLTVFIAGQFAVLNGRPSGELLLAEERKLEFLRACAGAIGIEPAFLRTADLWAKPAYWDEVGRWKAASGIISERKGPRFSDILPSLGSETIAAMPPGLIDALGGFDAPSLYRLFEVAEAAWMKRALEVGCKIGPASEQEYDAFIGGFMDIVQLRQPLDFRSSPPMPKPITPYIGKEGEERIFIEDSKREVGDKIMRLAQRAQNGPLFYGDFLNPLARLCVLAVESAAAADSVPVRILGSPVSDGAGALNVLAKAGLGGSTRLAPVLAECLWAYLIRPIQLRLGAGVGA